MKKALISIAIAIAILCPVAQAQTFMPAMGDYYFERMMLNNFKDGAEFDYERYVEEMRVRRANAKADREGYPERIVKLPPVFFPDLVYYRDMGRKAPIGEGSQGDQRIKTHRYKHTMSIPDYEDKIRELYMWDIKGQTGVPPLMPKHQTRLTLSPKEAETLGPQTHRYITPPRHMVLAQYAVAPHYAEIAAKKLLIRIQYSDRAEAVQAQYRGERRAVPQVDGDYYRHPAPRFEPKPGTMPGTLNGFADQAIDTQRSDCIALARRYESMLRNFGGNSPQVRAFLNQMIRGGCI